VVNGREDSIGDAFDPFLTNFCFVEEASYCREYVPALSKIYAFLLEIAKNYASQDMINFS